MQTSLCLTRLMFRSLGVVAPDQASRVAEKFFLTPQHFKPSERELKVLATGRPFTIHYQNNRVAAWSWGTSKTTVYLLHGWSGRGGQMSAFVEPLLAQGFSVVLFDAPGHGQSEGKTSSMVQFAGCLQAIVNQTGPAHAVIGHSIGGAATVLALQQGLRAEKAILIGSPSNIDNISREFVNYFGISLGVQNLLQKRIEQRFNISYSDLNILINAQKMHLPLLVFHDEDDRDVLPSEAESLVEAWPGAKLVKTKGLGHVRILRDSAVIKQAVQFIQGQSNE